MGFPGQFILFGDSITQQAFSQKIPEGQALAPGTLGPQLADAYVRRLDIINRGFSGYNTRQALHQIANVIPRPELARVRFITICFGANDARIPNTAPGPQQHIPLQEFAENIWNLVTHPLIRCHPEARIMLITPPPVDARASNRLPDVTAQYAKAVRDVGARLNVPVIDVWSAIMTSPRGGLDLYLHDGLHLTSVGYDLLFDMLMDCIESVWPNEMPEKLDFVTPKWDNLYAWG